MRQFNVRVEDELYEVASQKAKELRISLSDLIRNTVKQVCSNDKANSKATDETESALVNEPVLAVLQQQLDLLGHQLSQKDGHINQFQTQLKTKDEQISELHKLMAMGHQECSQLTEQLDRATLQLTDVQHKQKTRPWWRFWGESVG